MNYLIYIAVPSQGSGAFIGFAVENGTVRWIRDGNEWAALQQRIGDVRPMSDGQFADVLRANTASGALPPSGFLSSGTQQLFADRIGQPPPTAPTDPVRPEIPPDPGPPPRPPTPSPAPETPMPDPVPQEPEPVDVDGFIAKMFGMFPWIEQLGLDFNWFQDLAARSVGPEQVVAELRQTDQWKQRFAGIRRADGTMRMNESQYFQTEVAYRRLLEQHGVNMAEYDTPQGLQKFFESEMDANELSDRLRVYTDLKNSSQNVLDAFYVYAGLRINVDDLYEATVDPTKRMQLAAQYNERALSSDSDYETFINRATELAMERLATDIQDMVGQGVTALEAQQLLQMRFTDARQVMDAFYMADRMQAGEGVEGSGLGMGLEELLSMFEFAALGAAATGAQLSLPSLERIKEMRSAGVDRTTALRRYQEFSMNQNLYKASINRVRGGEFGQDDFERALFLGDPNQMRNFRQIEQEQEAAGQSPGSFRFDQGRGGDILQRGLRT